MSSGSGSKGRRETSTQVDIPAFLQPFLNQATGVAGGALSNLQSQSGGDLVAGFTPEQEEAFRRAEELANGAGGFLPIAQDTLRTTAQGVGIDSLLPPDVLNTLTGFGNTALPDSILSLLGGSQVPGSSISALEGAQSAGGAQGIEELLALVGGSSIPESSLQALEQTAGGDFLFGGEGFDQAVQAALRAAQPGIISTFGSAGAGGATGGLAQEAIGRAAIDAFASQFGQERGRQLSAAEALAGIRSNERGQNINALSNVGGLDLSGRGQNIDAASILANLGLAQGSQDLQGANLLTGAFNADQDRSLASSGLLAELSNAERNRQLGAAESLPNAGLLDVNLLQQIGDQRQDLNQRSIDAPLQAQLQLLIAALNGLPISSLLGQSGSERTRGFNLGFGGT